MLQPFVDLSCIKALIRTILHKPEEHEWTLQGFGMLRLAMCSKEGDFRLNIWDSRYRNADVSMLHDHPWDFESLVVSGGLCNIRFKPDDVGESFEFATLKPGPEGGSVSGGDSGIIKLLCASTEYYTAGESYKQEAAEIHMSLPEDGTITFNRRLRKSADLAHVFWRSGKKWVSAKPFPIDGLTVKSITENALRIL